MFVAHSADTGNQLGMHHESKQACTCAILACAGMASTAALAEDKSLMHKMTPAKEMPAKAQSGNDGVLSSLSSATEWLNSPPLTAASLRGKVVLIDVWTYTCINWLRTLPYVRAWAEKYKDQGLVVIGVHAPEFPFERNLDNVRRAVQGHEHRPIRSRSTTTLRYGARSKTSIGRLFISSMRRVAPPSSLRRGRYEQSERFIQKLLAEAGATGIGQELVSVDARGLEAAADWDSLRSPENYLGYERTERFASPGGAVLDKSHVYAAPAQLRLNHWALVGRLDHEEGGRRC